MGRFDGEGNAAVLRHALLGNIQLRHHLELGIDAAGVVGRAQKNRAQHAVLPHTNMVVGLTRFEMQIRRLLFIRVEDHDTDVDDFREGQGLRIHARWEKKKRWPGLVVNGGAWVSSQDRFKFGFKVGLTGWVAGACLQARFSS